LICVGDRRVCIDDGGDLCVKGVTPPLIKHFLLGCCRPKPHSPLPRHKPLPNNNTHERNLLKTHYQVLAIARARERARAQGKKEGGAMRPRTKQKQVFFRAGSAGARSLLLLLCVCVMCFTTRGQSGGEFSRGESAGLGATRLGGRDCDHAHTSQ
jgi:hypothetical protein